jgi:hypothetical protein
MTHQPEPCAAFRPELLEHGAGGPASGELSGHLAACADCRADLARTVRQVAALRALEHVRAPFELDGLSVAATQAGARQERAALALRALGRTSAPADLELRLTGRAAPAVLDRLVEEELADIERARVRRWLGRLPRLGAPAELRQRVASGQRRARPLVPLGAALVTLALVGGALALVEILRPPAVGPERGPRLVVERVRSPADLDPMARSLLGGLTGGLSDAPAITGGRF